MNCSHCKNKIENKSKFCGFCGHEISYTKKTSDNLYKKHSSKTSIKSLLLSAVGIALILTGIIYFTESQREKKNWKEALIVNTKSSYEKYITEYGKTGKYTSEARLKIIGLKAKKESPNIYEVFDTYKDTKDPFLNLREQPFSESKILYKLEDGSRLEVLAQGLGKKGLWVKVFYKNQNLKGYVHSRYIRKIY